MPVLNKTKARTIGSLINDLQRLVAESDCLTENSPIFIGDYNMSSFEHEFDVLPAFSNSTYSKGVCLFYNGSTQQNDYYEDEVEVEEDDEVTKSTVADFARWLKR